MAYTKKDNTDWDKVNAEKQDAIRRGQASGIVLNKYAAEDINQKNFDKITDEIARTYFCIVKADLKISEMLGVEQGVSSEIAKVNSEISKEGQEAKKLELKL